MLVGNWCNLHASDEDLASLAWKHWAAVSGSSLWSSTFLWYIEHCLPRFWFPSKAFCYSASWVLERSSFQKILYMQLWGMPAMMLVALLRKSEAAFGISLCELKFPKTALQACYIDRREGAIVGRFVCIYGCWEKGGGAGGRNNYLKLGTSECHAASLFWLLLEKFCRAIFQQV